MVAENIECVMESRTVLIGEKKLTELEVTNLSGEKKSNHQSIRWPFVIRNDFTISNEIS